MSPRSFRLPAEEAIQFLANRGALLSRLDEHGILIVSDFPLNLDTFRIFAAAFGTAEVVAPPTFSLAGYPHIRVQSNLPGVGVKGGGEYWHSDGPWSETPSAATLLLCEIAPHAGGETLFTDMRSVIDGAPRDLQVKLAGLRGRYPCRTIYERELTLMGLQDPEKLAALSDLSHPLVRRHPGNGRRALYLNEKWLESIEGLPTDESETMLASLYALATRPENIFKHRWHVGDLLVWDNASMMHKALPPAEDAKKKTYRITIEGLSVS